MVASLSKLSIALTIVFIISLLTLVAELFYVLWRRRIFHRRTQTAAAFHGGVPADTNTRTSTDTTSSTLASSFSSTPSKELLYFFCLNKKEISQVESKSTPPSLNSNGSAPDDEMEVIDVFKLQNMYGPSRVLFTIKEEEKEVDFESEKSMSSSAERISLEDCLKLELSDEEENLQEVKMKVGNDHDCCINIMVGENEMTSFSTPCESPLYFTPTASPTREE